jgi:putative transcriptional regulator
MNIKFHLGDDILLKYAAGTLDEASSLLVATHLALCPHCRVRSGAADALGGVLLDSLEEAPISASTMDAVLARLRDEPQAPAPSASATGLINPVIPDPLRSYLGGDLESLHWRMVAPRVHQVPIETADHRSKARLLRFHSGLAVPTHGHNGRELTLVLSGSLCDRDTVLRRGDIAETDERTEHQPYAGPGEDCVCLAVTDAPLRFKGIFARLLQPMFGI